MLLISVHVPQFQRVLFALVQYVGKESRQRPSGLSKRIYFYPVFGKEVSQNPELEICLSVSRNMRSQIRWRLLAKNESIILVSVSPFSKIWQGNATWNLTSWPVFGLFSIVMGILLSERFIFPRQEEEEEPIKVPTPGRGRSNEEGSN